MHRSWGRAAEQAGLSSQTIAVFPMAYGWLGRTRWGLPGVHGFYAGNDWELFGNLRPGDRVGCEEGVVGVEEKQSEFSGRLVIQYVSMKQLKRISENSL